MSFHDHLNRLGLLPLALLALRVAAQPVCDIDIGPDQTICQGETVILTAPDGFPTYLWSNGSNQQTITVGAAGNYWAQVSYPSGELVTNGNFSQGNTGFTTEFTLNTNLNLGDGYYWIGTNASNHHPQFFGTGNGPFMMVNSGWLSALMLVWCQEVTVCPGQTYTLSYRARTLSNAQPARLQWWINGVASGPEVTLPNFNQGWQTINHTWTSPALLTTANICLRAMSGDGIGNDFGLDDISMMGTIVLTDDMTLNVTPLPVVDLGPDVTLCQGNGLILDAGVAGGTYLWQDGSTGPGYVVNAAGNYSVTVTANGCSASDAVNVSYNPLPPVDLGPDLVLCTGETVVLDATLPGATYLWQDGSTGPTFTVITSGNYSVAVTAGGCTSTDMVTVDHAPVPMVDLGPDQALCAGEQVILDATVPGATYLWQDGSTGATFTAGISGTYSVTVTLGTCQASDVVDLIFNPLPVVDLGADISVCPGTIVTLDATVPGATYVWNTGDVTATIDTDGPGTYSVTVTANGCTSTDAVTIIEQALPPLDLGPDQTLCAGDLITLDATTPGATYLWSNGAMTPTITVGSSGIYSVTVTQGGCAVDASVQITVVPVPQVDLGADQTLCPGETATFDASSPGATYAWSTGDDTPTITVSQSGTYSVIVTNAAGCSFSDEVTVFTVDADAVDLGPDVSLCQGESLLLDATLPGATYLWNTGAITPTITAVNTGTYWVTVTQGPCDASDTVQVTILPVPQVDLGPDPTLCSGETATFDASSPGATYAWSTGDDTPTISVSQSGTYSVIVTNAVGCSTSDEVTVFTVDADAVDLGPDVSLCQGESLTLDATLPGSSYLWNTGAVTPTITAVSSGSYWVTVTQGPCSVSDTVQITVIEPGTLDLGPDVAICAGESITLDATLPGASYLWSTGAVTPTITVATAGDYSVTATVQSCTVSDAVNIIVTPLPVVDLGDDQGLCPGASVTFDATTPGASYQWHDGSTAATYTTDIPETVDVTVTVSGCEASGGASAVAVDGPVAFLGADTTLCAGATLLLDVSQPGATYLWDDGSTAGSRVVDAAGTYWVQVQRNGCVVSDTIVVAVFSPASVVLGDDLVLCIGESTSLSVNAPGASVLWSTGATSQAIDVSEGGTYWVTVSIAACTASDTVTVTMPVVPQPDLGPDLTACAGEMVTLVVDAGDAAVQWSTGSTAATITVNNSATYSVTLTVDGCSTSDAVQVIFLPFIDTIDLGPDRILCPGAVAVLDATVGAGVDYLWNTGSTDAELSVIQPGTYSVAALGPCVDAAGMITFTLGECEPGVHVPNAFTPDGDGVNDVFLPVIAGELESYRLEIFDRWGELLFTTNDPAQGWDGMVGGMEAMDGIYVWQLEYRASTDLGAVSERIVGHLTLLR